MAFLAHNWQVCRAPVPVTTTTEVSCLQLLHWGQMLHHHPQPANVCEVCLRVRGWCFLEIRKGWRRVIQQAPEGRVEVENKDSPPQLGQTPEGHLHSGGSHLLLQLSLANSILLTLEVLGVLACGEHLPKDPVMCYLVKGGSPLLPVAKYRLSLDPCRWTHSHFAL